MIRLFLQQIDNNINTEKIQVIDKYGEVFGVLDIETFADENSGNGGKIVECLKVGNKVIVGVEFVKDLGMLDT